jgi:L-seryl-tRNA(Ser) seleniumtransferase
MSDFSSIPSIERLRQRPAVRALEEQFGGTAVLEALRAGAALVRAELARGERTTATASGMAARIEALAASRLDARSRPSLQPVINATGVIVHTNLGRAPLAARAIAQVDAVACGYANLEYDLESGTRGRRDAHAERLLRHLTGAEAAVVVNNNAAATLLVLAALAAGREVVVSRGELVEIGGGFRVPEVLAQSGAVLREVGTTNKTRASDYAAALSERTGLILRVHPSNFRIDGFTERPDLKELVELGRRFEVPVAEDLGSGYLGGIEGRPALLRGEPVVSDSIAAGVDVCSFSGDKLLGGPQAGIVVGRDVLVNRLSTHPLMRAIRAGKLIHAALEATLVEYEAGRASDAIPVHRMIGMAAEDIRLRADELAGRLSATFGWRGDVVPGRSVIGGGAAPGIDLPTWLVALERQGLTPDELEAALRRLTPPVIARIEEDRVVLDLRTVLPWQDAELLEQLLTF